MKILAIPYSHILSHISRPLLVAKKLRDAGHDVVFAGESPKTKFIKKESFDVLPLYETDPDVLLGNIRKSKLKFASDNEIERLVDADLNLYNEAKPDLVLTDFRYSAPISTHIANLRHVAIVNVSSTEYRTQPFVPLFNWIPELFIKRESSAWSRVNQLNLKIEMAVFDNVMSIFKKLSGKYGIKKTVTATNCLTGKDMTLLSDIPEYFPSRHLPENYHYIGPLTWKSNLPEPPWWPPEGKGPLIYFTMGTTGLSNVFQQVYDLIKNANMTAIITTGAQTSEISTMQGKLYVESFIDGDLVMDHCDLVVCHGGNGTIYQALKYGKPVIGIPTVPDQQINMRRVEALGIGRMITWKDILNNPTTLLDVMKGILNDQSYYTNAQALQNKIRSFDAATSAADLIGTFDEQ